MRWGFFGLRGVNEVLNEDGEGFYFTLEKEGRTVGKFFYNIGQPDQSPPLNRLHKDDPTYDGNILLEACRFRPFYASVRVYDNAIEAFEKNGKLFVSCRFRDQAVFHPVPAGAPAGETGGWLKIGNAFYVKGLEPGRKVSGNVRLTVSDRPAGAVKWPEFKRPAGLFRPAPRNIARASVFFNLIASRRLENRLYVTVNRAWTGMMAGIIGQEQRSSGGPMVFGWDGSFSSVILAEFDTELAARNLLSVLESQRPDGRVPQFRVGGVLTNRTNPPVWFIAAEKIYEKTGDAGFLAGVYGRLEKNYDWFRSCRMNDDHTFSWGSDNEDDPALFRLKGKLGAVFESGLDDSPLFDEMGFKNNRLDYACIDLSSLMYRACRVMRDFAAALGKDTAPWEADLARYKKAVKTFIDIDGRSANSYILIEGRRVFAKEWTPLVFYPLLTGLLDAGEIGVMSDLYFSGHFRRKYVLPSLGYFSPSYKGDGDYWRGRIWPPMVYLAAQGFRDCRPDIYREIKRSAEKLLVDEWKRHNHVHENYSSVTGRGEPMEGVYARSCPFYSWGGLLGIL